MRLRAIGDLVAHTRVQHDAASVLQLGVQLAFQTQQDVSLHAPVIRQVARRVLHDPHAHVAELRGTPVGHSNRAFVLSGTDSVPVGRTKGYVGQSHGRGLLGGVDVHTTLPAEVAVRSIVTVSLMVFTLAAGSSIAWAQPRTGPMRFT